MQPSCLTPVRRRRVLSSIACLFLAGGATWPALAAATDDTGTRVDVSRDLWISAYPSEQEGNNGAAPRLKLKSLQEFFLIDFDPVPFAGQVCMKAQLHVCTAGPESLGRVTVSSIAASWFEGTGSGYAVTDDGSSFRWQLSTSTAWPGDGVDITGVVLGNGGSIWGFADAQSRDADGWQIIPIDPAVVQSRLDGHSHGFFVFDDVGSEYTRNGNAFEYRLMPNRFLHSRESSRSRAPYFKLWLRRRGDSSSPSVALKGPAMSPMQPVVLPGHPDLLADAATDRGTARSVAGADAKTSPGIRDIDGRPIPDHRLFAARGEAIGFLIQAAPAGIAIDPSPGIEITVFRTPLVDGHVDPLVPVNFTGLFPTASGPEGEAYVELYVNKTAAAGPRNVTLRAGEHTVPLRLTVWDFALPDQLSFIPQMNAYSVPGDELSYFRLAHKHRTTLNHLRYGWSGKPDADALPQRRDDGDWDWTTWDARFGPLLDGSAFADSRRPGVPVEAFYLPINENWPMDHERHFRGGYWIEDAYEDAYWRQFRDAAERFATHIAARRWHDTMFEFYLNNKVYFKQQRGNRWDACSAAWIFDEPTHTQDFWALRRFGREFWLGVEGITGPHLAFRVDISRPQWQRDLLDDVANVEVVSGSLRAYRERVIERAERLGNLVYMYGSAGPVAKTKSMPAAWCVETWALGGDGVVPWQTIGSEDSWRQPDPLSLFYPTTGGPIPSIRLKAFRDGQQLIEYLTIYCAVSRQHRRAVGDSLLADRIGRGATLQQSEDDAGVSQYSQDVAVALYDLRLAVGTWLDAQAPQDRRSWFAPFPSGKTPLPHDPRTVVLP